MGIIAGALGELESFLRFDIEITDSAQGIGIGFRGIDGGQNDGVIGSHAFGLVHRMGVAPLQQDILLDSPVACFVCVGQSGSCHLASEPNVVELAANRR